MELHRSQRQPKPKTIWEEKSVPCTAKDPKIIKRTDRTEQKTALKPVASGSLPKAFELDVNQLSDLPAYKPSLELRFEPSKSLLEGLSELDTFQRLFTSAIIDKIVILTNNYVENVRNINSYDEEEEDPEFFTRSWKLVNTIDI